MSMPRSCKATGTVTRGTMTGSAISASAISAARPLTVAAVAWLFFLTPPAFAQLSPALGEVAESGAESDVFRTYIEPDDAQFSYFTPGDSGLSIGLGAGRSAVYGPGEINQFSSTTGPTLFGARLAHRVGPIDLAMSGRRGTSPRTTVDNGRQPWWSTGVEIGLSGLSIAGSYTEGNGSDVGGTHSYDASLRYRTGPWGFALAFNSVAASREVAGNAADRLEQYTLALNYRFAAGAQFGAFGRYVAAGPGPDSDASAIDDDVSGFVFGTGFRFEF